jgi:hypothetical protein
VLDAGDNTETAVSIRRLNYGGPALPPKADICSAQADVRRTIVGFCPLVCERFVIFAALRCRFFLGSQGKG